MIEGQVALFTTRINEISLHLKENPKDKRLPALKSKLVVALQDEAQKAINAYLRGDQLELNRRIYMSEATDYNYFYWIDDEGVLFRISIFGASPLYSSLASFGPSFLLSVFLRISIFG